MPEGITLKRIIDMDETEQLSSSDYVLVDSSTGGPKKFAIGEALGEIKDGLQDIETALDHKAEIDGYYQDMTVGDAEQLLSSVGINDSVPYNFRTSGGSADIGDRLTDKVVGGTIAWNQLCGQDNSYPTATNSGITRTNNNDGTFTFNGTSESAYPHAMFNLGTSVFNHVVLAVFNHSGNSTNVSGFIQVQGTGAEKRLDLNTSDGIMLKCTPTNATQYTLSLYATTGAVADNLVVKPQAFDLTQMFGSAIADYIYSLEQSTAGDGVAWFKKLFPKPYYEYNAGELMSVQTSSHDTVGFNAWDGETEAGYYDIADGAKKSGGSWARSKNFVPCLPNMTYCYTQNVGGSGALGYMLFYDADKTYLASYTQLVLASALNGQTFTTPQNAHYMAFYINNGQTTGACINLSWDGERDGEYEPYVKHTYPLDSDLVLRGIPKLDASNSLYYDGDTYESDGTVNRRYGVVTLDGSENWTMFAEGKFFAPVIPVGEAAKSQTDYMSNLYLFAGDGDTMSVSITTDKRFYGQNSFRRIWIYDSAYATLDALKTALTQHPMTVVYPLTTSTTETADPYQNPQIVDDFGTEEYVDAGSRDVAIPVGHETFYAANLKAKLEMSPDSPSDGDGDYIVRQTNGTNEYVKMVKELPTMPTSNGTYHLKVTVASGTPTLSWEADI